MRWKHIFFLNNSEKSNEEVKRESFGFKLKQHSGELKELDNFEKDLFNVVTTGKFRKLNRNFQEKNEIWYLGHQIINDCAYICR